jgi:hypothetical protein
VRWNFNMVLICISFVARDVEHLFMCFLAIYTFSFEQGLFRSFAHFVSESLIFFGGDFSFLSSLCFLVIYSLSDV